MAELGRDRFVAGPAGAFVLRPSTGEPFDNSLFRVIRVHKDPALRAAHGPVHVDEPRSARADEPFGPGTPVDLST